jgi:hypothetical protein
MAYFHLELYSSSVTNGSLLQTNALSTGNVIPTLYNGYQVPSLHYLAGSMGVGAHLQRIQLQARSFLPYPYPDMVPVNRGTAFESPVRGYFNFANPRSMQPTEELDAYSANNNVSAETQYIGALFSDGPIQPVPWVGGFTVHGTASSTLSAGAWTTNITITLDTNLPAGIYQLVGLRVYSATCLFARVFPRTNNQLARPGITGVQTYDGLDASYARYGAAGVWHTFPQNVAPGIDIFATSADTAEEFWLDLIPVGPNMQGAAILGSVPM